MYDQKITTIFKYITQLKQSFSLDEKFYLLMDMAKELIDADRCTIWRYNKSKKILEAKFAHGVERVLQEPMQKGIVGECFNSSKTVIKNDVRECDIFDKEIDQQTGYITESIVSIPIKNSKKETVGVFQALNKKSNNGAFHEDDLQMLDLVTLYIAEVFESTLLYEELEQRVQEEIQHSKQKDIILIEQAKNAALGDMIGNIAHQWRQPLNAISFSASAVILDTELEIDDKKTMQERMEFIIEKSNYLSKTIDVFRDFVKNDKEYKRIDVHKEVKETLQIIQPVLDNNEIGLRCEVDFDTSLYINMVSGELQQVVLNIINNAKDALVTNNIKNRWIELDSYSNDENITISIEDNAGGISDEVKKKIYEPYFTTKHQHQGTGLGLHICYRIITESLMGKLYEQNTEHGAKFFIQIPKHTLAKS